MRILLIIPPLPERTYPGKAMAPDYLASVLVENEHSVRILDLDVLGSDALQPTLHEYRPDIVGITNLSLQNDLANGIVLTVKKELPTTLTIKGGFHELFGYEITMKYHHAYVDYVVVGEGERTLLELVEVHSRGELVQKRKDVRGLAFYERGKVQFTGRRPPLSPSELDEVIPKRLFHSKAYDFDVFEGRKTAQVMTVRGCANACNFCMEARTGRVERRRCLDSIFAEIDELAKEGYEAVYFDDSTFTRDRNRVKEICEMWVSYFPGMVWGCNTRDDCLDEELITLMERSNCVYLFTGFESAITEVLLGLNKTHNPSSYLKNAKIIYQQLGKNHIKSSVFLIFGAAKLANSPTATHGPAGTPSTQVPAFEPEAFEDVKKSIDFSVQELQPRHLSMNILRLLPGAPFSGNDMYHCIRPRGEVIHAGFYDKEWYRASDREDIRTKHHIYRAFEARGSIVPPQMTPEYCYNILKYAIDAINIWNTNNNYNCKIIVDKKFEEAYLKEKNGKYELAPFKEIAEDGSL